MLEGKAKGEVKVCDGNRAAAYGVLLSEPDVIAVYPVTAATPLLEDLCRFKSEGLLNAEIVEVEGETSAIGTVIGASAAGGRVFTATAGPGLAFMFEGYTMAGMTRLPVVMVNVSRDLSPPGAPVSGEQDIMGVLDCGWVHIHVEDCQEIMDSVIMAYRLAEDPEILLAVCVCYDGWYLSYQFEPVEIPSAEQVKLFLPSSPPRPKLDVSQPKMYVPLFTPEGSAEYRRRQQAALERVKEKIDHIDKDFEAVFGRSHGGQIEEYALEDAEITLIALGSCVGTAKEVVDKKREEGMKLGLIKVRLFRPFPKERIVRALRGKKVIGVIDRNVCFGWNCGHLFMELKAALYGSGVSATMINFIDGIAGGDITSAHVEKAIDMLCEAYQGKAFPEVNWLQLQP